MQYKVPQNVDIEDKVVGPLSLRQFIIILVTVGVDLMLYFIIPSVINILFWMLALIISAAGVAIAFTNYGGQNMETFLLSAWKTFSSPRQRVWKKVPEPVQTMTSLDDGPTKKKPEAKKPLTEERDDLNKLAELVDSGGYVNVAAKDRVIGEIAKSNVGIEEEPTTDVLEKSEANNPVLQKTLEAAEGKAPSREPLISEVASIKPPQDIKYPKIETRKN